ncbi:MAG: glycosyltransferase family 4 protein [Coriobacteriaceae bacterium]|nr:glycosyltransferase family 4 protein [Coriobacteriaceae bacterium]
MVSVDARLGDEVKGATRYTYLATLLAEQGWEVDFITASFQHWEKRQRDLAAFDADAHPFTVRFIEEPGYPTNMCPQRIWAHHVMAKRVAAHFERDHGYDLIYCQIPPNDVTLAAGRAAHRFGIPFVIDVNDLWPEAFRVALNVPVVSDLLFAPFERHARRAYALADAIVGTSEEYAARGFRDRAEDIPKLVLYVGNDLAVFDGGAAAHAEVAAKPAGETWVAYAGNISALYDLETLVEAVAALAPSWPGLRLKVLGDGPGRGDVERAVARTGAPADVLGYLPYEVMAAYLMGSDVVVNSLVADAPQSVPTKIGDYLASGHPMVNTSMNPEFRAKVERDGFGVNVRPGDAEALAAALEGLLHDAEGRDRMGRRARAVAEAEFDRRHAYRAALELIEGLVEARGTRPDPRAPADAERS